jgi:hypothetical protein
MTGQMRKVERAKASRGVLVSEKPSCKNTPTKPGNKRFTHLAIAGEKPVDFAPHRAV